MLNTSVFLLNSLEEQFDIVKQAAACNDDWEDKRSNSLRRERNPRSVSLKQLSGSNIQGVLSCLRKGKKFYSRIAWESQFPLYQLF